MTPDEELNAVLSDITVGRLGMRAAFIELSDWARLHGFDADEMIRLHGVFFDGNERIKRACFTLVEPHTHSWGLWEFAAVGDHEIRFCACGEMQQQWLGSPPEGEPDS